MGAAERRRQNSACPSSTVPHSSAVVPCDEPWPDNATGSTLRHLNTLRNAATTFASTSPQTHHRNDQLTSPIDADNLPTNFDSTEKRSPAETFAP